MVSPKTSTSQARLSTSASFPNTPNLACENCSSRQKGDIGQFLAVFSTDDAKAFYHQQYESARKSYKELSGALKERYERAFFNGHGICRKS
jgi:hypothetical protein